MKKDPQIFLKHILGSIEWVERFTKGVTEEEFLESVQTQDAVVRRLEVIGEAAKNLPNGFKARHRDIPWQKIAGMRNALIHEYFGVDLKVVWDTVKKDLPPFKKRIQKLLF